MAGVTELSGLAARPVSAAQQFRAVAYLRWCLFRNGFRRKGGAGELAARIVVFPIAAGFVLGPMAAAGSLAYSGASDGHLGYMLPIFAVIFVLQILISINISPPGLSFDPESLIRFPVTLPRYLTVRLFLGLLSASTIVGTMSLLAAALGVSLANHSLAGFAFAAAISLAICNMLFVRMVFAWVDRWLSTRRAREFFTFFIIVVSIGIQYLNFTFNGFGSHHRARDQMAKIAAAQRSYHHFQPALALTPPGLAASSIVDAAHGALGTAMAEVAGVLAFAAIFLAIFTWRMEREYRGENLSEVNHAASDGPAQRLAPAPLAHAPRLDNQLSPAAPASTASSIFSPELAGAMHKEWIMVRRNPAQFYGLLVPFAMVFLFAARANTFGRTQWIFPGAIAYSLLGLSALAYNALGLDGAGVQLYFMAPVSMRTIFLAKNLFGFIINAVQVVLIYTLLAFTSGAPPFEITVITICWAVFAALVNITVANMRSIKAPKKIDPSKLSRKQGSQLSALMSVLLILVAAGIGGGLIVLGHFSGMEWLPIPILLALDLGAIALYLASLKGLDAMVAANRETLLEELTKASV